MYQAILEAQRDVLTRSKAFDMLALAPCFVCNEKNQDLLTTMEDKVVCDNCYDRRDDV